MKISFSYPLRHTILWTLNSANKLDGIKLSQLQVKQMKHTPTKHFVKLQF